jgi:glycine C-acetyltransferase
MVVESPHLRETLFAHARRFRAGLQAVGFRLLPGEHPIIPVMIGDAALAARFAERLLGEGIYVIAFSFPVVPRGEARIRTQMSAGLTDAQLERALAAFAKVGQELKLI